MTNALTKTPIVREYDADFSFPHSRVGLVFTLLRARTGMLVKLNLLLSVFALPAIAALFLFYEQATIIGHIMPYSANFGVGYPVVADVSEMARGLVYQNSMQLHLWMTLSIALFCVALSGAFYVLRGLARGEVFSVVKGYFVGIKRHFLPFLIAAPFLAGLYFLIGGGISAFDTIAMAEPLKVLILIAIGIVTLIVAMAAIFFFTQVVTFRLDAVSLLKNSFILAIRLIVRNLFVLAFTVLPFLILSWIVTVTFFNVFGLMLAFAFIFSYAVTVWTVYAHWVFDTFLKPIEAQNASDNTETA